MPDILEPREAWDAAEEQIEIWLEDRSLEERLKWRMLNSY